MGAARGRLLTAYGVVTLIQIVTGRKPSKTNGSALEACASIWEAAGYKGGAGDPWVRHVKAALGADPKTRPDALMAARMTVGDCIKRSSLLDAFPPETAD